MKNDINKEELIEGIVLKYLRGETLEDAEFMSFKSWLAKSSSRQGLIDRLQNSNWISQNLESFGDKELRARHWQSLLDLRQATIKPALRISDLRIYYYVAASILLLFVSALVAKYSFDGKVHKDLPGKFSQTVAGIISPGRDRATLILPGGRRIDLDSTHNGLIARQAGADVQKTDNGKLEYKPSTEKPVEVEYNTLVTPRGGQYSLQLADGSKVWLNAASTLKYPSYFTGKERRVELTGEAYFEIASSYRQLPHSAKEKIPFIVTANGIEITVKGTHFNVNSYPDEPMMKTTLLEGSVEISKGNDKALLHPGEQAKIMLGNGGSVLPAKISIDKNADVDEVMSWKNGFTSFQDADIGTIMRKVSRWYDVDVTYQGNIPKRTFMGGIPRNSNFSDILKVLETYNIHFILNGRKITMIP